MKHHIFAVSGVSGGGVGAGLVAALVKRAENGEATAAAAAEPCRVSLAQDGERGPLERQVLAYLAEDFLAPLVAGTLFPDMLQRFIPWPPIGLFDRARAFEASLEQTWTAQIDPAANPLRDRFRLLWRPEGDAPMLVLNTTRVETGEPVVVAPFRTRIRSVNSSELNSVFGGIVGDHQDLPLSTALGLTARYPLVLPAGAFADNSDTRLVDGGYFENSGIDVALLLMRDLTFYKDHPDLFNLARPGGTGDADYRNIEFRLVILNEYYTPELSAEGLNELLSPVRALYRTRVQRGRVALDRALASGVKAHMVRLSHDLFPMPLGWQFAAQTQKLIDAQIGRPAQCVGRFRLNRMIRDLKAKLADSALQESIENLARLLNDNRCALHDMLADVCVGGEGGACDGLVRP